MITSTPVITSTPSGLLFTITKGGSIELPLLWADASNAPINVTTWDFDLVIRERASDTAILLTFTRGNGRIVAGLTTDAIILRFTRADSLVQTWTKGEWDMRVTIPGSLPQTEFPFGKRQPAVYDDTVAK